MSAEAAIADASIQENLEQFLIVLSVSLSVATLSQIASWFRRIPYTLLLVIVGLGLAFVDIRLVDLSPELILEIFLPPLLFEAAWNIRWRKLRENWLPVSLFAIAGVVISVLGVAFTVSQFTPLPLALALLVGASLAATDPVSVVALFRELGAGERLTVLMEGESLFNDGVAVVAFTLLVGIPLGTQGFSLVGTLTQFGVFVGVGAGIGSLIGFGISYLTQRFDLPLVEQSLTLISAYGTYLIAEELGGSGVIGVVTVGIILGNFGSRIGMNPRTRLLVSEFWEFIAFFTNSIVFLLIGDQVYFTGLRDNFAAIAVAIVAVLITRAVGIFGLGSLSNLGTEKIAASEQTVLWWGGLRGSVSIALALSVPISIQGRQSIIEIVFGVVLFTLLVQGLTMRVLLAKLGLTGDRTTEEEYKELMARRVALKRVLEYMQTQEGSPEMEPEFYRYQMRSIEGQLQSIEDKISKRQQEYPQLRDSDRENVRERLLDIEADTYAEFIRSGRLDKRLSPLLQEILVDADD